MQQRAPLVLIILDGWGYSEKDKHNAIARARTPQWDSWWQNQPHMLLQASGRQVGLPEGQMGNSEVGHMHIGAGRLIDQDLTRINAAIQSGAFEKNAVLNQTLKNLNQTGNSLHITGLFSSGGVHSHEQHLFALLALCHKKQAQSVHLHLILDGRDTAPQSALQSLKELKSVLQKYPGPTISSLCGRYYAMDRDKRWERLEPLYELLTQTKSKYHFPNPENAVDFFYHQGLSDEFIPPTLIGEPRAIQDGDAVLFFNFRSDRARQLSAAFIDPEFKNFQSKIKPQLSCFITMTQYDETFQAKVLFPKISLTNTFGEILSNHGLSQLRIAETEKYAHVTFFFNGGSEKIFPKEQRVLIPSPKIATYDLQPEMSAPELTRQLVDVINKRSFDVIICNYANADMVGHSGNFEATLRAIECLDTCLHRIWKALALQKGQMLITADHGNAESMFNDTTNQAHTAHTSGPVPLVFLGEGWHFNGTEGNLIDIAPTMLALLGIKQPKEMTGRILLEPNHGSA